MSPHIEAVEAAAGMSTVETWLMLMLVAVMGVAAGWVLRHLGDGGWVLCPSCGGSIDSACVECAGRGEVPA